MYIYITNEKTHIQNLLKIILTLKKIKYLEKIFLLKIMTDKEGSNSLIIFKENILNLKDLYNIGNKYCIHYCICS